MWTRILMLMVFVSVASGCGLKAQSYVMTKPRVGIEKGNGNAGYLSGTPVYIEPEKKTRKVYVLEITKAIPEGQVRKIEEEVSVTSSTKTESNVTVPPVQQEEPAPVVQKRRIVIPKITDEPVRAPEVARVAIEESTYTVQKDDTLQKIAKKHYGNYAAWLKIYNANKEKIKNPNLVKPGTILTLPAEK